MLKLQHLNKIALLLTVPYLEKALALFAMRSIFDRLRLDCQNIPFYSFCFFIKILENKVIAEDIIYPAGELYETSLVNIKVLDTAITPENDNIQGFSSTKDRIDGLVGGDRLLAILDDAIASSITADDFIDL